MPRFITMKKPRLPRHPSADDEEMSVEPGSVLASGGAGSAKDSQAGDSAGDELPFDGMEEGR